MQTLTSYCSNKIEFIVLPFFLCLTIRVERCGVLHSVCVVFVCVCVCCCVCFCVLCVCVCVVVCFCVLCVCVCVHDGLYHYCAQINRLRVKQNTILSYTHGESFRSLLA